MMDFDDNLEVIHQNINLYQCVSSGLTMVCTLKIARKHGLLTMLSHRR